MASGSAWIREAAQVILCALLGAIAILVSNVVLQVPVLEPYVFVMAALGGFGGYLRVRDKRVDEHGDAVRQTGWGNRRQSMRRATGSARSARFRSIASVIASAVVGAGTIVALNGLTGRPLMEPFVLLVAAAGGAGAYSRHRQVEEDG